MSLDYWLYEATGDFPAGVRRRLAREYAGHLAESILAGGTMDAYELFGDPKPVRKKLATIYVSQKDLNFLEKQTHWRSTIAAVLSLTALLSILDSSIFNITTLAFYFILGLFFGAFFMVSWLL